MNMHQETPTISRNDSVSRWYGAATVRNAARILVPKASEGEWIFPRARQVICDHPLIEARGENAIEFILAQCAYRYMYEIGLLETRFVTDCALNLVNNKIGVVSEADKRDALTIVIDEGYHAYVALDFIVQMKENRKIEPLEVPDTNGNLSAVARAFEILPESAHMDFQLVSVCLAEHTLTKDLLSIGKEKETSKSFTQVMTDHVSDEGRHATYFAKMMENHWKNMSDGNKTLIGKMLPPYLDDYLIDDRERSFEAKVLHALKFSAAEVKRILDETEGTYRAKADDYIVKTKQNLVRLLQRTGILDHAPTRAAFVAHGLMA